MSSITSFSCTLPLDNQPRSGGGGGAIATFLAPVRATGAFFFCLFARQAAIGFQLKGFLAQWTTELQQVTWGQFFQGCLYLCFLGVCKVERFLAVWAGFNHGNLLDRLFCKQDLMDVFFLHGQTGNAGGGFSAGCLDLVKSAVDGALA